MEYFEGIPWTGDLFHPVTGNPIIEDGVVIRHEVAAYWKIRRNSATDHKTPVVIRDPELENWWEEINRNHPDISYEKFSELIYTIDVGGMFQWDNFITFTVKEADPHVEHFLVCILDPSLEN